MERDKQRELFDDELEAVSSGGCGDNGGANTR